MNTKTKRRLVCVTGIIVIITVAVLAVVGSAGAARGITVNEALDGTYVDERVQVTGLVVDDSYEFTDDGITFSIQDSDNPADTLQVSYKGAASSTFGNGITVICTGVLEDEDGNTVLNASEMVTQCPSKYESATGALSVTDLLDYGESIISTTVRVTGTVEPGTLSAAGASDERFVLQDTSDTSSTLSIIFDGALSDAVADGVSVVVTGALSSNGVFIATDVALEG